MACTEVTYTNQEGASNSILEGKQQEKHCMAKQNITDNYFNRTFVPHRKYCILFYLDFIRYLKGSKGNLTNAVPLTMTFFHPESCEQGQKPVVNHNYMF